VYEFSQVLRKAAAEIEEGGAVLESIEDEWVGRGARETEIDKAKLANTRIGVDFPGSVALGFVSEGRQGRSGGRAYDVEDVGNNRGGTDVAVVLEKVSLGFSYILEGWLIPPYALVPTTNFEAGVVCRG
jgi:hypothetical protein